MVYRKRKKIKGRLSKNQLDGETDRHGELFNGQNYNLGQMNFAMTK